MYYPVTRASQSGGGGLSLEPGGWRKSGRRESDGWLHTGGTLRGVANCGEVTVRLRFAQEFTTRGF